MSITATMDVSLQSGTPSPVPAACTTNVDLVKKSKQCGAFGRRSCISLDSPNPTDRSPPAEYRWTPLPSAPPPSRSDSSSGSGSGSRSGFGSGFGSGSITDTSSEPAGEQDKSVGGDDILKALIANLDNDLDKPEPKPGPGPEPEPAPHPLATTAPVVANTTSAKVASRPLPVLFPTPQDLLIFDRSADVSLKQRFNDILDRLEEPLLRHVYKPKEQCQPISIRFGYLGVSELEAQPSMIVFCSENKGKKVWKFFKKSLAKELCQPSNNEFPALAIYVVGARPCPRLWTMATDVLIAVTSPILHNQSEDTYCGAPIRLVSETSPIQLCATLGGMIKTRTSDSGVELLAMTAGHVLDIWRDLDRNSEPEPDSDSNSDSNSDSDSDSQLADPGVTEDQQTSGLVPWSPDQYHQVATSILTTASEGPGRYYDWAVFKVDKAKRNMLPGRPPDTILERDLIMPTVEASLGPDTPRSVAMLSASSPISLGVLTDGPSRILLRPGKSLVSTLILTLDEGSTIADGDSGSWVVDPSSLEVFGHVVASDILGDVYVVPIRDTFKDIKQALGVSEVTLPTIDDIRHVEMQHNLEATEDLYERSKLPNDGLLRRAGYDRLDTASETTKKHDDGISQEIQTLKDENVFHRSRIRLLEEKVSEKELSATKIQRWVMATDWTSADKDMTPVSPPNMSIISKVRECNFMEFTNRFNNLDGRYAVDVLVSGELLHQEMMEEHNLRAKLFTERRATHRKASVLAVKTAAAAMELIQQVQSENAWPRRVRIQSPVLLQILARIHGEKWPNIPRTYCRPFSALIYRHEQVREVLSNWEKKLGDDIDKSCDTETDDRECECCAESESDEVFGDEDLYKSIRYLRPYVKYIDEKIMPDYRRFETLEDANSTVRFSDLWYLFRTGELIYREVEDETLNECDQQVWRTYRVNPAPEQLAPMGVEVEMGADLDSAADTPFSLMCYHIDYTGSEFCIVTKTFEIKPFGGELSIKDLPVYPIRFQQDADGYLYNIMETGNSLLAFIKAKHCVYRGWAVIPAGVNGLRQQQATHINSEIMVDFTEAFQSLPVLRPKKTILQRFPREGQSVDRETISWWLGTDRSRLLSETMALLVLANTDTAKEQSNVFISQDPFLLAVMENEKQGRLTTETDIPLDSKVLLTPRVFAYVFQQHTFMQLSVTRIRPTEPKAPSALEALQIPQEIKQTILFSAHGHLLRKEVERRARAAGSSSDESLLDLALGKGGLGLFILLHGSPGIGKTFTTEVMARALGKPLFHIHISRLAMTLEDLDTSLHRIFRLAAAWDCILVLDEVNLLFSRPARTGQNLLSVFLQRLLQRLESYDGIVFLTTTQGDARGGWEAFTSRMHYVIYYQPLTLEQTLNIWRLNIQRARKIDEAVSATEGRPPIQIHEDGLLAFAKEHFRRNSHKPWNGRQIRNAFQAAHTIAYDRYREQQQQLELDTSPIEPVNPPRLDIRHFETIDYEWLNFDNAHPSDDTAYSDFDDDSSVEESSVTRDRANFRYNTLADSSYEGIISGLNIRNMADSGYVGSSVSGSLYRGNMGDSGLSPINSASISGSSYYREELNVYQPQPRQRHLLQHQHQQGQQHPVGQQQQYQQQQGQQYSQLHQYPQQQQYGPRLGTAFENPGRPLSMVPPQSWSVSAPPIQRVSELRREHYYEQQIQRGSRSFNEARRIESRDNRADSPIPTWTGRHSY